jgi:CheY-like chemotaxis protein
MSGYSDAGVTARAQAGGIVQVVRKPLSIREIAECLAHAVRAATHAHSA